MICFLTTVNIYSQASENLSDAIENKRKANGKVLAFTDNSGLRVSITYKKSKVAAIEALDKNGEHLIVTYEGAAAASAKGTLKFEPILCKVCITKTDGTIIKCWQIKCSDMPVQKAQ
ncbi:hypothetical protein CAP36_08445 [Chitinophagaceae bacterium IBVUCB2]|nr:hypothetical protein CAP36_08445 [Chitinophagaceae bacterium IBVUCB2]